MTKKNETIIKRFMKKSGFKFDYGYHRMTFEGREYNVFYGGHFIIATTEDISENFDHLYDDKGEFHYKTISSFLNKVAYRNTEDAAYDFDGLMIDTESVKTRITFNKVNKTDFSWTFQAASGEYLAANPKYMMDAMTFTGSDIAYLNMDEWKSGDQYKSGIYFESDDKTKIVMILPRVLKDDKHVDQDANYSPWNLKIA